MAGPPRFRRAMARTTGIGRRGRGGGGGGSGPGFLATKTVSDARPAGRRAASAARESATAGPSRSVPKGKTVKLCPRRETTSRPAPRIAAAKSPGEWARTATPEERTRSSRRGTKRRARARARVSGEPALVAVTTSVPPGRSTRAASRRRGAGSAA